MPDHMAYQNSNGDNTRLVLSPQLGLLKVRTANKCMQDASEQETPLQLCGNLWFESEISILFADTNVGKSILAVQIGDKISQGDPEGVLGCHSPKQKVLIFDFELSDKQFQGRYSIDYARDKLWDSNFLRVQINPYFTSYEDFEKQLLFEIEWAIVDQDAKVVIIDNITYLRMQSTESGKEALPLMKNLVMLKQKYNLSLLILAHTPKRKNAAEPITVNDLAGSKQIANFVDSIFCIGRSCQDSSLRYVKQIKARSCQVEDQVFVFRLEKNHNFLEFTFCETDHEKNHLVPKSEAKNDLVKLVVMLKEEHPDWSHQQIADEAGTYKMKVSRILKDHNS